MIPIRGKVTRDHRVKAREFREISKRAWQAAGEFWHAEILPRHFEPDAARVYRYQRRSRSYEARKLRQVGHRRPLEFSGELRRTVARTRDVRTSGTRGGAARIVLRGPRYLYAYRKDLKQPDKAAELKAVSYRDARDLARVLDERLTAELELRAPREDV